MTDSDDDIDAPRAADRAPAPQIDRTISPVSGRLGAGRAGKAVALAALVAGCGVFMAATWAADRPKTDRKPQQPARQVVRYEPADLATPTLADPGAASPSLTPATDQATVPALEAERPAGSPAAGAAAPPRPVPIVAYRRGSQPTAAPMASPAAMAAAAAPEHELDRLRQGSTLDSTRARRLGDRNYLILAGATLPCVLMTAMDTATPGYVSCLLPRDVMSDNGAVVLMEKGTRVLGEYRSGMRQGQTRLFVLWTRAVTPAGVAVDLASPASDGLGRAGFDGDVDTHFWDRFGGAMLLSVVDAGAPALQSQGDGVRFSSDAAGVAVQGGVNIPPTLRKDQGGEVAIFVARDLDFSTVYGLRSR